ncbi:hypothetical protein [Clostridium tagluense]|uniref:hypothetical protein n=2 Tax=Clostridium tagluense TaxID=360422 RepID=UPI001CF49862|nr:hypothetical protein [Clostridium tagluense]MCB2299310.1 hypothetical protein [Clostridium tagluense]
MKNNKLNFFYFGEDGNYGNYNPDYICNKNHAPQILYLIASNEPFSISKYEIVKILNMSEEKLDDTINNLQLINAIEVKDDTFRIKFPVFLEEDVIKMKGYLSNIGQVIGDKIISLSNVINQKLLNLECSKYHSKERILYHIICEDIFDHTALAFFTKRNIFSTPKLQPDDRDYIRVAYEDIKTVVLPSSKLIYSSTSYRSYGFFFLNRYGYSNDSSKDMYRFFRLIQKGIDNETPFHDLNIGYNTIIDDMNKEIVRKCGKLISNIINKDTKYNELTLKEKNLVSILKELGYADINQVNKSILINVPLFYASEKTIIEDISDTILLELYPVVRNFFENFKINVSNLTSIRHMVDIKEISNELWHQIFGSTNEYLVKKGFIELPHNVGGESLYLRSITTT